MDVMVALGKYVSNGTNEVRDVRIDRIISAARGSGSKCSSWDRGRFNAVSTPPARHS
jgi:hypothetical protein